MTGCRCKSVLDRDVCLVYMPCVLRTGLLARSKKPWRLCNSAMPYTFPGFFAATVFAVIWGSCR